MGMTLKTALPGRATLGRAALALCAIGALAACDPKRTEALNPEFDGVRFKASAKRVGGDDPRGVVATARPVSASRKGALSSADHQAKLLCIFYFGSSDITWANGSLEAAQRIDGESLQITGRCDG